MYCFGRYIDIETKIESKFQIVLLKPNNVFLYQLTIFIFLPRKRELTDELFKNQKPQYLFQNS